jgi:hypothetical protein
VICINKTPGCPFSANLPCGVICGDCQLPWKTFYSTINYKPNFPAPFLIDLNAATASSNPTQPAVSANDVVCCR